MDYETGYKALQSAILVRDWKPTARIVYSVLRILAFDAQPQAGFAVFFDVTEARLAELTGLSEDTCGDVLRQLVSAGLVQRRTEAEAVNRLGEVIPAHSMTPGRGDHWQTTSITAVPLALPEQLPLLAEAPRQARAKKQASDTRKLAQIGAQLMETACPECGAIGDWHLACGACGTTWTARELATGATECEHLKLSGVSVPTPENPPTESTKARDLEAPPLSVSMPALSRAVAENAAPETFRPSEIGSSAEVLTGAATVDYLADLGAEFCFVQPGGKAALNPRDDENQELPWQQTPITAEAAKRHLARGGNIGLLTGRANMVLIDVDGDLADFLTRYPHLAGLPRFTRQNAPDRAKLLAFVSDDIPTRHCKGLHCIDLLGAGAQGVIAGMHHTGAAIEFHSGDLAVFTFAQLEAIARAWAGLPDVPAPRRMPANVLPRGDLLRTAIRWFNETHQAEVDSLLASCKRSGGYIALRSDDDHPSARQANDAYARSVKRVWRDFGSGETLDDFEIYCRLACLDKRSYKWQIVDDFLVAQGKQPLTIRR